MFEGLLAGGLNSPLMNIGAGLLSVAGPSYEPQSMGQGLARGIQLAQSGQGRALQNQLIRDKIAENQRRRQASERLQGLLVPPGTGEARIPQPGDEQRQMLGLLAQVAPEQVAQGLLGQMFPQERAEPSDIRTLRAIGIDPQSEDGQKIILDRLKASGVAMEQLDAMLKTLQIRSLQDDMQKAQTEKERTEVGARISTLNSIDRIREAAEINARMRGTMAETGMGFNELRQAAAGPMAFLTRMFGGDEARARQTAADMGRFEQLTRREAISDLFSGQAAAGTLTDAKMRTYLQTKPGFDQLPETNNRIFADMLKDSLDSATQLGISVSDREDVEALIKTLRRGEEKPQSSTRKSSRVIDFNSLPE